MVDDTTDIFVKLEDLVSYLFWVTAWRRDIERTKKLLVPYTNYRRLLNKVLEGENDKVEVPGLLRADSVAGGEDSGG